MFIRQYTKNESGTRVAYWALRDRDRIHVYEVLLEFLDDGNPELDDVPNLLSFKRMR